MRRFAVVFAATYVLILALEPVNLHALATGYLLFRIHQVFGPGAGIARPNWDSLPNHVAKTLRQRQRGPWTEPV